MNFKQLERALKSLPDKIDKVVDATLLEYAQKIMSHIPAELAGSYRLEQSRGRVTIWTENEIAAYIEFGTGQFAANYLSGQEQEVRDDAIQFYISGTGTMPAKPYLFPAYYRYRDELIRELDKRIQAVLNSI